MTNPTPIVGPRTLYRHAWDEGHAAYTAGVDEFSCPYVDDGPDGRPFTRRAWCDGWRYALVEAGLKLPADIEPDETTPPPRDSPTVIV